MLELADLTVSYGQRRALEGVSLTVGDGEIVTLLGANGSGKSTTLRAISGLVRPAAGRIRWDGRDVHRWPADAIVAAGIGHVPEGRDVFPEFTVLENLQAGAHTVARHEIPAGSRPPTGCSRSWAIGGSSGPARCRAANSRCWPSPGPS